MDDTELVKIGDLAREARVTTRTVRFYEDLGLIRPVRRSDGGFRLYRQSDVERLRAVLRLKEIGFSLDEIREFQAQAKDGDLAFEVMGRLRSKVAAGARQVRDRLRRLQSALEDLEATESVLARCDGCEAKAYDGDCHACWKELAGGSVPAALKAVM
ncbi:MAG: MerR family transcriptional regulator [Planctomycetota bacterium JB042]